MSATTTLCGLLATAALVAVLPAQVPKPVDGPPWWAVSDNDTVSIYWDFNTAATPYLHSFAVVPGWYTFPTDDGFVHPAPITWLPTVTSHTGCIGFTGTGTPLSAVLSLVVDNDPRVDWIKVFFVQVDVTDSATEKVVSAIREVLGQYKRVDISETTTALGSGWSRVTINAELLPQPDWEAVDSTLTETALGTVAIDNLFVSSKCIKPPPDEKGDAMSDVDAAQPRIPLANTRSQAVAVTEDPAGVRSYWVSAAAQPAPGSQHQLLRLDSAGATLATTSIGAFSVASPFGLTGLTVERVSPAQSFVYGVRDERLTNGNIEIVAIDAVTGAVSPNPVVLQVTGTTPLPLPPAPHRFGLVFSPPGNTGAGSFWLIDNQDQPGLQGSAYEFARSGALLRPSATAASNLFNRLPRQVTGAGYDELTGMFYFMSSEARNTPLGVTRTNGVEISAYDDQPTGVQFFGDLTIPDPVGPGGAVAAMHVYRRHQPTNPALNGAWRAAVIALAGPAGNQQPFLYELKGPFRFGWNLLGRCGMSGGPPMRGTTNFQVTLTGVPHANFAVLYAGFSNTVYGTFSLPLNLGPGSGNVGIAGLEESNISVSLDLSSVLLPVTNGSVAFTVPLLPAGVGPANVPLFFQWVVFDPSTPFGLATSQCGKTLIF